MDKVSFVVPIYNTDIKKVRRCVHSIQKYVVGQSYEINLIDDGSKQEYSKEYKKLANEKIAYFYKLNGGVSSARNMGIEKSNGEYLCFLDSDDFLTGWVEINKRADIVICNLAINNKKNIISLPFLDKARISSRDFLSQLTKNNILNAIPGKIFKKSFLVEHNIRFNENLIHGEDLNFLLEIIKNTPEIIYISKCIYIYMYDARTTNNRFKKQPFKILNNYIYNFNIENNLLKKYNVDSPIYSALATSVVRDLFNLYLVNSSKSYSNELRLKIIAFLKKITEIDNSLPIKLRLILLIGGNSILIPIAVIRNGYLKIKH